MDGHVLRFGDACQLLKLFQAVSRTNFGYIRQRQGASLNIVNADMPCDGCFCAERMGIHPPVFSVNQNQLSPPVKNSGAPHSSSSICATLWQNTVCQGSTIVAKANAFAAVPVPTR